MAVQLDTHTADYKFFQELTERTREGVQVQNEHETMHPSKDGSPEHVSVLFSFCIRNPPPLKMVKS